MSEQPEAPAPEKSGKLPEWASFTAAVTLITIFAFGISSFYVAGLASSLREPLAIYFSPTDYLRITTSWAIPPLGVAALVFLVLALFLPRFLHRWQNLHERFGVRFYLTLLLLAAVLLVSFALIFLVMPHTKLRGILFVIIVSLIGLFTLTWGVAWVPTSTAVKVLLVTVPFSMSFALLLGSAYEPYAIDEEPLSRVLFESEKDHIAAIKGKAIFDLDRFLLLSTEDKSGSHVVAIPNEKIKSIETPPLPAEQEMGGD